MAKKVFLKSRIASSIDEYINYMRSTKNLVFKVEKTVLYAFDNYCVDNNLEQDMLTESVIEKYARSGTVTLVQSGRRYRIIFKFYEYLKKKEPGLPPIREQVIEAKRHQHISYIYTDEDIDNIINYPMSNTKWNKELSTRWQLFIGLLVVTGCRVNELAKLKLNDIDEKNAILLIREAKFHKTRLVPIDRSAIDAIKRYIPLRLDPNSQYLFVGKRTPNSSYCSLNYLFNKVIRELGIGKEGGIKPRLHDFRHSFAVRKVSEWTKRGENVQTLLPILATYMGHVHYSNTAYYLESSSEILRAASERFSLITEVYNAQHSQVQQDSN